jgi:hypothetical protein
MKHLAVAFATFVVWGCSIDSSAPAPPTGQGGGGAGGAAGKGGGATGGGAGSKSDGGAGRGGSGGVTGGAGGGSAGSAGSGGAGTGGTDSDGSIEPDAGSVDASQEPEAGFPEASTCAGYGLQLDGFSAYATVTRMVQDDFTLEAWIKADGPSPTGSNFWNGNGIIYADIQGNANDFGTSILNNHFVIGIGNPGGSEPTLEGLTDVTTGQWYHVAATRRESTGELQVYVYAQLEASIVTANHNPLTAQSLISLGADVIDSHYFKGVIDEVRIWNVVRSQSDLASTMHVRLAGNEPGLVGYWRFDEPGASTALDSSPTHANGSFYGGVNWVPSDAPVCGVRRDAGTPDARPDVSSDGAPMPDGGADQADGDGQSEAGGDAPGATD